MALKLNFYGEVRSLVEQVLLAKGFSRKRSGIYWYPINEETVAFVGLNESKWRGETQLEINPVIGVTNLRILRLLEELGEKSEHPLPSQVNRPLGYLMPDPTFRVWVFTPDIDVHSVAQDLVRKVMEYGIPWVRKHGNLEALLESMRACIVAWPASLKYDIPCALLLLGRAQEAREHVEQSLSKIPTNPVFDSFRQFADRLRERATLA